MVPAWFTPWLSVVALFISVISLGFTAIRWRNSTRRERAWVIPKSAVNWHSDEQCRQRGIGMPSDAAEIRPVIELENGGITPALNLTFRYHYKLYDSREFPEEPDFGGSQKGHLGALGAGQIAVCNYDGLASSRSVPSLGDVKVHRKFLFIYGIAEYQDIFGTNHETKWCYIYNPDHQHFDRHLVYNDVT